MARQGRKRKTPVTLPPVHDRRSTDLVRNASVAIVEVDDPYAIEPGGKITVLRSLRDDPLARMSAAKQIDSAQFEAGRAWQADYEEAEVGGASAIDPTKEAVDGGKPPEMPRDIEIVEIGILRLPATDRHVCITYYTLWEPPEVVARKVRMSPRQMQASLYRSRVRIGAYIDSAENNLYACTV